MVQTQSASPARSWQAKTLHLLRRPVVFMFLIGLGLVLLNLFIANKTRAYNSDDVAWQSTLLTWRPFTHLPAYFGSDPFILKIPFFLLVGWLFKPSHNILFFTSLVFGAANYAFFYGALVSLYRTLNVRRRFLTLLPAVWLGSMGFWFSPLFLNPNLRNFELGLSFVMFAAAAHIYHGKMGWPQRWWSRLLVLGGIGLISALIVNDLYFFYFGVAPLGALLGILFIAQPSRRLRSGSLLTILLLAGVGSRLLHYLVVHSGIVLINSSGTDFVPYKELFPHLAMTVQSTLLVFNADFFGRPTHSVYTGALLLNCALLLYGLTAAYRARRADSLSRRPGPWPPERMWLFFFLGLFAFVLAVYGVSETAIDTTTFRYLVILPYVFTVLIGLTIGRMRSVVRRLLVWLLIITMPLNFYLSYRQYQNVWHADNPNIIQLHIIDALRQRGLTKGYATYWDGNITTYLSDGAIHVVPYVCRPDTQQVTFMRWLVDSRHLKPTPDIRSFFMINPDYFSDNNCRVELVREQFGKPAEIFEVENRQFWVYDYDLAAKILP